MILSINRTCQKSEFNRILLEKRTQRNPALCEFAFLVSVVYARKHCILKEVGYHVNIDLFFFFAVIWSTNSIYSKYFFSRYYTLLFDISSRNLCIDSNFSIKKRYVFIIFVTFGLGGYPLGKGSKKGTKMEGEGQVPK